MTELRGVLTALVTPFAADGEIDEPTLRAVVDHSVDAGVGGVVACGSTGEFTALTADERRFVVETVVDQAAGRVPVVAQTGALTAREAIAHSRHAQAVGADVLMLVTPFYEALTLDQTLRYLRTVAGAVEIPVMLYNLPPATGVNLDPDTVGALAREIGTIRYVKETSADMSQAARLIHHHGDVVSTIVGWDALALSALCEGAAGVMCGSANAIAPELVAVARAAAAGDLDRARAEWARVYPLIDALLTTDFIPGVKAATSARGLAVGDPREPLTPLDGAARARVEALVAALPEPVPA
ncbi:dihydrodipicolinate synthase family protein [Actinomycetospora termitidis]|uniref:Dihydrodipicolinate synthase family protein n=1 Tax=Actinomycetospora termitidis TaxID=3053470 RepID=A0ABT7MGJ8_9PSEU|nr:dihydrodipicolinate synthase family protein [Actinomycetospora sp. Odt1-22]MDL5159799.1 dihydrodipicolinate synthase family protein [Actinomycetospora sp. Odt1-22]